MADFFNIPLLNSFRWVPKTPVIDSRYNSRPFDLLIDKNNPNGAYYAKWQTDDKAYVQLLSDFVPVLKFYRYCSNEFYLEVPINQVSNNLIGVTFKSYQAEVDFADFDPDDYYGEITYAETLADSTFSGSLVEPEGPDFVDVNLQFKIGGVEVWTLNATGSEATQVKPYGSAYSFQAFVQDDPTAADPKMGMIVRKDGNIIFSGTVAGEPGNSLLKTGIAQPGSVYTAEVVGCNGCADLPSIDIPDTDAPPVAESFTWQTSPLSVADIWENTGLFEYKNTFNTQGVIFQPTGLEFTFRVEGWVTDYDPESDNELYTDQKYNVSQENSVPFRNFTMFLGTGRALPDWVIDKVNLIFSVDQKRFDGVYYEKSEAGTKFTPTNRAEATRNKDAEWSLAVIPNENFFLDAFNVGDNPDNNDFQVIVKQKEYLLNGANIAVAGVFKNWSTLVGLQIVNRDLETFNISVGTALAASDIGIFSLSGSAVDFIQIGYAFNAVKTVYIAGLAGHDTDVRLVYYQLDDKTNIPSSGGGGFVKGTVYMYYELSPGDFATDFNIASGLGNTGTKFEGCAIMDGRNGTFNMADHYPIGWDITQAAERQTEIGANTKLIDRVNLPAEGLEMFTADVNLANGDTPNNTDRVARARNNSTSGGRLDYEISKGYLPDDNVGRTKNMGSASPLDIRPLSLVTVYFVKLVD